MLGNLIERIRKERGISKTELAGKTKINIGHLTHIEKGNRKPSHKSLRTIADALNVPYQSLFASYDRELDEKQLEYDYIEHITYNQIPAFSKIDGFIDCPSNFPNATFAFKATDNTMAPIVKENAYVFVELNGLIKHKEIGLFRLNGEFIIRKLLYKREHFILKANDRSIKDITVSDSDSFQIIGKICS